MKRIVFAAAVVLCLISFSFAQTQPEKLELESEVSQLEEVELEHTAAPVSPVQEKAEPQVQVAAPQAEKLEIFAGKADLIYLGDSVDGLPGRIDVVDENGQKLIFYVIIGETAMVDKNGLKINLTKIDKGEAVVVKYVKEAKNRKIARSLQLPESQKNP